VVPATPFIGEERGKKSAVVDGCGRKDSEMRGLSESAGDWGRGKESKLLKGKRGEIMRQFE